MHKYVTLLGIAILASGPFGRMRGIWSRWAVGA